MILTTFDFIILGIMGFFIIIGLMRGFIRELFSVINWFASGILAVLLRPYVNGYISQKVSNSIISNLLSSATIFILLIILFSILITYIVRAIDKKFPKSIDITLGLAFGFLKGFLISSIVFISILNVFGDTDDLSTKSGPKWLQNSQTYRPLSFGAYLITPFTDSIMGKIKNKYLLEDNDKNDLKNSSKDNSKNSKTTDDKTNSLESLIDKTIDETTPQKNNGGYKKNQREKLDRLINIIEK